MMTSTTENSTASGLRMRSMEVVKNSNPTSTMMKATISPAMYSMRP